MSHKEKANLYAAEIQKAFGFIVMGYHDPKPPIGMVTHQLWRVRMPQPFVVLRDATREELKAQIELVKRLFNTEPVPDPGVKHWLVMVTD